MIDFDALGADLDAAIKAINTAIDVLRADPSDRSLYARIDLQHIAGNLNRGRSLLDNTEEILKGGKK